MDDQDRADRAQALERKRALKMASSTHAYVRGNTAKFYEWLARSKAAKLLPVGPAVWICGDCHVGNLGPLADSEGRVDVQIRDLDQTVVGNPAHDLIRLGLSLATAARGSDLPGVTTARMIEEMVDGYEQALADRSAEDVAPSLMSSARSGGARSGGAGGISPRNGSRMSSRRSRSARHSGHCPTRSAGRWTRCSRMNACARWCCRSPGANRATRSAWSTPLTG